MMSFYIGDRKVKILTGRKSQTVNVYVNNDVEGEYNPKVRINDPAHFVTEEFLRQQHFPSVEAMASFLIGRHGGKNEGAWPPHPQPDAHPIIYDPEWARRAVPEVERAINALLDDFIRFPYLHRVEHSIHCALYRNLMDSELLLQKLDLGAFKTGVVHKEWPETTPRPEKRGRRGNFDLVILAPPKSGERPVGLGDFIRGFIRPAIVVELGLDYDERHLKEDVRKLKNSEVAHGYLVHLARWIVRPQDDDVRKHIIELIKNESGGGPHIAYAYIGRDEIHLRRLREAAISEQKLVANESTL